jgi:hypothetical protein
MRSLTSDSFSLLLYYIYFLTLMSVLKSMLVKGMWYYEMNSQDDLWQKIKSRKKQTSF